jgi:hypothetical protein
VFDAYMKLRREDPEEYNIAAPGEPPISRRQFRFKIEHWELTGKSGEGIFPGSFSRAFDAYISIALARQITDLQNPTDLKRIAEMEQLVDNSRNEGISFLEQNNIEGLARTRNEMAAAEEELAILRANVNKQPFSICHADQMGEDYPATIIYSAQFDIWKHDLKRNDDGSLGPELITTLLLENQSGVATATKVQQIPPTDIMVAFEKPYENKQLGIRFASGTCSGMRHITKAEFLAGANKARAMRGLPPLK